LSHHSRCCSINIGLGVRPTAVTKIFTQGNLKQTNNNLDLAIQGDGFFQIQLPDGRIAYTRDGAFKLDANGNIVTSDGYKLIPEITLPATTVQVSIGADGVVSILEAGQTKMQQIGQIQLAKFINPAGLHSLGSNLYINTSASGDPIVSTPGIDGLGEIRQGFIEMSNVQLVEEMTDLITGQRAYDAASKAIMTSDEMLQTVNNLKR